MSAALAKSPGGASIAIKVAVMQFLINFAGCGSVRGCYAAVRTDSHVLGFILRFTNMFASTALSALFAICHLHGRLRSHIPPTVEYFRIFARRPPESGGSLMHVAPLPAVVYIIYTVTAGQKPKSVKIVCPHAPS